jgi:hypothetical protein
VDVKGKAYSSRQPSSRPSIAVATMKIGVTIEVGVKEGKDRGSEMRSIEMISFPQT